MKAVAHGKIEPDHIDKRHEEAQTDPRAADRVAGPFVRSVPGRPSVGKHGKGDPPVQVNALQLERTRGYHRVSVLEGHNQLVLPAARRKVPASDAVGAAERVVQVGRYVFAPDAGLEGDEGGRHNGLARGEWLVAPQVEIDGAVVA